jgi:peptidoglycan-associated lipoprotein
MAQPVPMAQPVIAPEPEPPAVIYFKPDAYKFEPAYQPMLAAHAKKLKAAPNLHLVIQAFSDPRGARDYNLALSKKRAQTVARFLVAQGVPQDRLELVVHGEPQVRDSSSERVARAADRRVELQYRTP